MGRKKLVETVAVKNQTTPTSIKQFLTGRWHQSHHYLQTQPPFYLTYDTLMVVDSLPELWFTPKGANLAARGEDRHAIWAGYYDLQLKIDEDDMKNLSEAFNHGCNSSAQFSADGEFNTLTGQIPLTRLLDLKKEAFLAPTGAKAFLEKYVYTLQSPGSSQWELPFLRIISAYDYDKDSQIATVRLHIYYTRLLFELISDDAVKMITENLKRPSIKIIPTKVKPKQTKLFTTSESLSHHNNSPEYRFSLAGLIKCTENKGYRPADSQPPALNIDLYEFQKSSYQWMLDQERDAHGINAYFWEEWEYPNGVKMYYFPLAGEFRLTKPPKTNGGLLCEEMGLGKTVEIIALILGNPLKLQNPVPEMSQSCKFLSKATLIIVPPTLLGQWFNEFQTRITMGGCDKFTAARLDHLIFKASKVKMISDVSNLRLYVESDGTDDEPGITREYFPWGKDYDGVTPMSPKKDMLLELRLGNDSIGEVVSFLPDRYIHSLTR